MPCVICGNDFRKIHLIDLIDTSDRNKRGFMYICDYCYETLKIG